MSALVEVALLGALAVVAFDAIVSLLSRRFGFRYAYASPGSFVIYAIAGYFAMRAAGPSSAFLVGAALGATDATAGWAVSWALGPGRVSQLTMGRWLATAVMACAAAAACAGLGALAYES